MHAYDFTTLPLPRFAHTSMFLAGVAVLQALAATSGKSGRMRSSNAIGAAVCIIAAAHYATMHGKDLDEIWGLRYSDWYPTTALLLIEFFWLMTPDNVALRSGELIACVALCVLMIFFGQLSRRGGPMCFGTGCLCGAAALALVFTGTNSHGKRANSWAWAFLAIWTLYPVSTLLPAKLEQAALTGLDIVTKGIFGVVVALLTLPH